MSRKGIAEEAPKLVVTEDILKLVRDLAGLGFTQQQIADFFGVGRDKWVKILEIEPDMNQAFLMGKAQTLHFVTSKLISLINEGNPAAIFFFLKTQHRWRETDRPGESDSEKPRLPAITLNISDPVEAARIYQEVMLRS